MRAHQPTHIKFLTEFHGIFFRNNMHIIYPQKSTGQNGGVLPSVGDYAYNNCKGLAELLGGGDSAVGVAGYHDVDAFEWHCAFATHSVEVANRFHRSCGLHFSN